MSIASSELIAEAKSADPLPAGKLGMWFFLASEAMFFVGLLGSFVVLESAGGQHQLFVKSAAMLSKSIGVGSTIMLVLSSAAITMRWAPLRWIALLTAATFILMQGTQWSDLLTHRSIISHELGQLRITDGTDNYSGPGSGMLKDSIQAPMTQGLDLHSVTPEDLRLVGAQPSGGDYHPDHIQQDLDYGPSRNNFFGCYFLFTGVHCLHLIAGMIALLWFTIRPKPVSEVLRRPGSEAEPSGSSGYLRHRRRNSLPPSLQIYWHFVNVVGVLSLAVLYFV